ncbi:response regulator [Gorillibacterium sp. CAU 1737]|uniref:response regulator n=1 Tax=Gorillibacterium sp. CAU 1737 TaxID=3140362 RepID=UPI003260D5F0
MTTDELLGRKDTKLSFIVADDVDFICDSIESILKKGKHECLAKVNNGLQLLAEIEKAAPDVIFLDINMPEMDGLTALEKIQKQGLNVKVIMVSADSSTETKEKAIELGAIGYITKPFLPEHIETVIKTME